VTAAIGIVAPLANAASLNADASPRDTANVFTSMNAGVLLALLLGVLGTTGSSGLRPGRGPSYRRAIGTKARVYGLIGAGSVVILGGLAAAIALPILHARGLPAPSSHVVAGYFQREAIAAVRLALLGVAIGVAAVARWRALSALVAFLAAEAVAEAYIPFIKNYGPIGALNAFSDPSHHHQLSIAVGGAIALAWSLLALVLATLIGEARHERTASR
jgi:hypothetical protein